MFLLAYYRVLHINTKQEELMMNQKEKADLRKDIRKSLIDELNTLAQVTNKNYKMKFNMLYRYWGY